MNLADIDIDGNDLVELLEDNIRNLSSANKNEIFVLIYDSLNSYEKDTIQDMVVRDMDDAEIINMIVKTRG